MRLTKKIKVFIAHHEHHDDQGPTISNARARHHDRNSCGELGLHCRLGVIDVANGKRP